MVPSGISWVPVEPIETKEKMHKWLILLPFAAVSFIQNMAFTWSSRSRNSGDPSYHRKAAWASNGVYYITNALLTVYIVKSMDATHSFKALFLSGLVYTLATAEGSVLMMKKLLSIEAGKRMVGASQNAAKIAQEDWDKVKTFVETELAKVPVVDKFVAMPGQGAKL